MAADSPPPPSTTGFSSSSSFSSHFPPPSPFPRTSTPPPAPAPPAHPPADIRTCRICFDQVAPPYPPDDELGKLISPCVCKGSSRFVHQGCLQQWRLSSANQTNFYQCPTCNYQYQFRRLKLAAIVGSTGLRVGLTSSILLLAVYLLGFVSEPIINTYLDPPSLILTRSASFSSSGGGGGGGFRSVAAGALLLPQSATWTEHMLRGVASLGLLGFLKVIYLLGPSSWWNLRSSGIGAGMGRTGRDRAAQISWVVVAIGVVNFFVFTWRQVGGLVRTWMEKAADEILEVNQEKEEEEEEEGREGQRQDEGDVKVE